MAFIFKIYMNWKIGLIMKIQMKNKVEVFNQRWGKITLRCIRKYIDIKCWDGVKREILREKRIMKFRERFSKRGYLECDKGGMVNSVDITVLVNCEIFMIYQGKSKGG